MFDLKEILGFLATFIALVSYVPYIKDVWAGKTKPHLFTWLIWGMLTLIALIGQVSGGAGPGSWPVAITTVLCFLIILMSLNQGKKDITRLDFSMLVGAGLAIFCLVFVRQPELSVIFVILTDALGFVPTVRKSWYKPQEETRSTFVLSALKHFISLFALRNYSLLTALYPSYLLIANILFVSLLVARSKAKSPPLELN